MDGHKNRLDLDSDNDGIYDADESGYGGSDINNGGMVDGPCGLNGLMDALKTIPDSGILITLPKDTDSDFKLDCIELDSDDDGCNDVHEAGYPESNADGVLGGMPITVTSKDLVIYSP